MSMVAGCPSCGKKFKVGADKAGKKFKCPCGAVINVPAEAAAEADPWDTPEESSASVPRGQQLPPAVLGRSSTAKPVVRKKAKSGGAPVGMIIGIVVGVVGLLGVFGVGAWMLFFRETSLVPNAVPNAPQTAVPAAGPTVTAVGTVAAVGTPETPRAPIVAIDFRKFLPEDAQVVVSLQPLKALESKLITKVVPEAALRSLLARMKRDLPTPLETIASVTFANSPPPADFPAETVDGDPSAHLTAVIQLTDAQGKAGLLRTLMGGGEDSDENGDVDIRRAKREAGKRKSELPLNCWEIQRPIRLREIFDPQNPQELKKVVFPESCDLVAFSPDDQTLVIGLRSRIISIAKSGGSSAVRDLLKDADVSREVIVAGTKLDEFKPPLKMLAGIPGAEILAMPLLLGSGALSQFRQALLQVGLAPGVNLIDLRLQARDDAAAQQFERQLQEGKQQGKTLAGLPAAGKQSGSDSPGAKFFAEFEKNWKLTRTGSALQFSVGHTQQLDDSAIAALGPALRESWSATGRTEDMDNLTQMGLAIPKFHESHNWIPPGIVAEHSPRYKLPLEKHTSWLAEILPYVEQGGPGNNLNSELPWDSPYNRKAGATVVSKFVNSQIPVEMIDGLAPTHIVGIGGLGESGPTEAIKSLKAGAFAYRRQTSFRDIRDGLSNTMVVAQVYSNFGPWIANTNATIRPFTKKPYLHGPDGIGGPGISGPTLVVMADGSVRTLADNTDPKVIESLATINGDSESASARAIAEKEINPKLSIDPSPGTSTHSPALSPDGSMVAVHILSPEKVSNTVGLKGYLVVWDLTKSQKKFSVPLDAQQHKPVAFSPNGKWIGIAELDPKIQVRLFDAESGTEFKTVGPAGLRGKRLPGYEWDVTPQNLQFTPDSQLLVLATNLGVYAWDTKQWNQAWLVGQDPGKSIMSMSNFTADGKAFVTGTLKGGHLVLWNLGSGKKPTPSKKFPIPDAPIGAVAISRDGHYVAAQPYSVNLMIFDAGARRMLRSVPKGNTSGAKQSLAFLPDNKTLVYSHADGSITLEDAVSGTLFCRLLGKTVSPERFSITPDGTRLIGGGYDQDKALMLWEIPKR